MTASISSLQAAAGRFLTAPGPLAWEGDSRQRHEAMVRAFQAKQLDPAGLEAALAGERMARPVRTPLKATALLELSGVLMPTESIFSMLGFGTSVRTFMERLTLATYDPAVKSIAIVVDSPGGSVRMLPEAAALMRLARSRKPVVVSVAGMAASAAYWIASAATAIEATASGSVGSIGIIATRASIAKLLQREGVDVAVFSAGKFKSEGHEALPITEAERKARQAEVDAAYTGFVSDVALGRHSSAATIRGGYGEGRLVSAPDAVRLGMIDRIALVEDTLARLISAPADVAAVQTQRLQAQRTAATHEGRLQANAEIAAYRQRLVATARRSAMR